MARADLKIDWATHEAAKHACVNWHYSKCLPTGKIVKIGVWEENKFIGVVLFSRGASPFLLKKYNISPDQGCELTRIAMKKHQTPVSRIVKIALVFLKKKCPELRLVVSFADPEQGHIGGVYQAGNWIYSGTSNKTIEYYVNGKWRYVRGAYYKKTDNTPTRERLGKHRYLMPLDDDMKKSIILINKQYPKREKQAMDSFPESQRRGSTDLHAPVLESSGEGFSPLLADVS
jgi:hypothetical protein